MNTQTLNETQLTELDDMLDRIVADTNLHTSWINTLSFLEHCGARKIHRTDFGYYLDETILSHAAEEARHALFYKKMVRKIDPPAPTDFDFNRMLCGYSGFRYFQSLDSGIERRVHGDPELKRKDRSTRNLLCYLYVTTLVEERAMSVFTAYNDALIRAGLPLRLDGIIREEEGHLDEMQQMLPLHDGRWIERLDSMRRFEREIFARFALALQRRVFQA